MIHFFLITPYRLCPLTSHASGSGRSSRRESRISGGCRRSDKRPGCNLTRVGTQIGSQGRRGGGRGARFGGGSGGGGSVRGGGVGGSATTATDVVVVAEGVAVVRFCRRLHEFFWEKRKTGGGTKESSR